MLKVSLVIINDDASQYCRKLFESIKLQIPLNDLDIILIDNCSTDDSLKLARNYGIKKIFAYDKKIDRRGVLFNKGLELAAAENIIFAHSDIYFAQDFLQKLFLHLEGGRPYTFINFAQYYADANYFGNHKIGVDFKNQKIYYRQLFQSLPKSVAAYLNCSEGCFMLSKQQVNSIAFSQCYQDSFFEYDLLEKIKQNRGSIDFFADCKFTHYFIEQHEKIKTFDFDSLVFIKNNPDIFHQAKLLRKGINLPRLKINFFKKR